MKAKKVQQSDFDIKKWGLFLLFLVGLGLTLVLLMKPEGEAQAQNSLDRARILNRKARDAAMRSNEPQDLAQVDESSLALSKANAAFTESEYLTASAEAEKAIGYAEKVLNRDAPPLVGASIRIAELVGNVELRKKGNSGFERATDTGSLGLGDEIKTSPTSSCLLTHRDGTQIWVLPKSLAVLREDTDPQANAGSLAVFLETGSVNIQTTGAAESDKFGLSSNVGSVSIYRETDATAELAEDGNSITIQVRKGRVDARSGKRAVIVGNNQQFNFSEQNFEGEAQTIPEPPRLVVPVRSSKFNTNDNGFAAVTLNWEAVSDNSQYHIQVSSDILFVNLVEEKQSYSGTSLILPNLTGGSYFWRVASTTDKGGRSMFASPLVFEVLAEKSQVKIGGGQPPMLQIKDAIVQGSMVIVSGTTSRDASVKLNGELALVNKETGEFNHILKFHGDGLYKINVVAEGTSGVIAFKNVSVQIKE